MAERKNPSVIDEKYFDNLPEIHPARMEQQFTQLQEFAFPVLMWFFDKDRYRGTGRTFVMARVCIELAMRGQIVYLDDLSTALANREQSRYKKHFYESLARMITEYHKGEQFDLNTANNTLTYRGRYPK